MPEGTEISATAHGTILCHLCISVPTRRHPRARSVGPVLACLLPSVDHSAKASATKATSAQKAPQKHVSSHSIHPFAYGLWSRFPSQRRTREFDPARYPKPLASGKHSSLEYGPFLGTLHNGARLIMKTPQGTI